MPVETPFYFAQAIQDHLALKRRNSELERAMPLDHYKGGDPFDNHPLFKTEEQARHEETQENLAVEAHMLKREFAAVVHEEAAGVVFDGEDELWSRSREFDWGD